MTDPKMENHENVGWILHCSVSDENWEAHKRRLTDEELLYCLEHETRKTGLAKLRAEARRRGLTYYDEEGI